MTTEALFPERKPPAPVKRALVLADDDLAAAQADAHLFRNDAKASREALLSLVDAIRDWASDTSGERLTPTGIARLLSDVDRHDPRTRSNP